ncbi:MAG: hypothetical protein WD073_01865 [Xanthobacteraceae bacterium]
MRFACAVLTLLTACLYHAAPARADHQPALIVPGSRHLPVIVNGYDVSWGTAVGDWGLYRPGHVTPVFIPAYVFTYPAAAPRSYAPHYFPATGNKPRQGRVEVIPPANRRLPPPAPSFNRFWMTPPPPPATTSEYPNYLLPPVVVAPEIKLP